MSKTLDQHIEITPGIAGGKPHIAGHRITVQDIAIWHERLGRSADEIAAEYELSLADVYAALAYYFDHRTEIDRSIEEQGQRTLNPVICGTWGDILTKNHVPAPASRKGNTYPLGRHETWSGTAMQERLVFAVDSDCHVDASPLIIHLV